MGLLSFTPPAVEFTDVLPLLIWLGTLCAVLLLGALVPAVLRGRYALVTFASAVAVAVQQAVKWSDLGSEPTGTALSNAVAVDRFAVLATIIIAVALGLVAPVLHDHLARRDSDGPEQIGRAHV